MRVAIVGGGAVGNMAAWRLARYGAEVLLLEQFALDHDRGSSYGDSRIIRRVYPDGLYTELMAGAYPLWQELMTQTGDDTLFVQSGGLYFGDANHPDIHAAQTALLQNDVPHEILTPNECARKFPAFRLANNEVAISEPSMGYARASKCVRAASALAHDSGKVKTLYDTRVTRLEPGGKLGGVRLCLDNGHTLQADALILCAGAWTNTLLKPFDVQIPLKITRQVYFHLLPKEANDPQFAPGAFPVWIDASTLFYGFPHLGDVPGVKLAQHTHGAEVHPDRVNRTITPDDVRPTLEFAAERFPRLSQTVVYEKVCLYSNTPDEDFVIDAIPNLPNAFVFSACSGHGFKFTPLMGEIAARLATEQETGYDLTRFHYPTEN